MSCVYVIALVGSLRGRSIATSPASRHPNSITNSTGNSQSQTFHETRSCRSAPRAPTTCVGINVFPIGNSHSILGAGRPRHSWSYYRQPDQNTRRFWHVRRPAPGSVQNQTPARLVYSVGSADPRGALGTRLRRHQARESTMLSTLSTLAGVGHGSRQCCRLCRLWQASGTGVDNVVDFVDFGRR